MNFPMFGANVNLLFLVLFFYRLISNSQIMCWFSFSCVLCYGYLHSQEHQAFSACFISSYVCLLVICKFFKNAKPPILVFFFLCLLFCCLQAFKSTEVINLLPSSFALQLFNELQPPMFIFFLLVFVLWLFISFLKAPSF